MYFINEIEQTLRKHTGTERPSGIANLQQYIGTKCDFIGLSVPLQRKIAKAGFSFSKQPFEEQLIIWNDAWKNADLYEVMNQALFFISANRNIDNRQLVWDTTRSWIDKVDNWAHSDGLSDIYSLLLEQDKQMVYPTLQQWNTSANSWQRRQSLVSLLEYSKKRKQVLPVEDLLPLVQNLLIDPDYFVQKGLGWTLREIHNIYPEQTFQFLEKHHFSISSNAFSAATEKLTAMQKELLKSLRKQAKQKVKTL